MMLVTDAHGGSGGIARHNCDVIDALSASEEIGDILVVPRLACEPLGPLPAKVTYDLSAARGMPSFIARSLAHGLAGRRFDMVHCGHINLMPVAGFIGKARRLPVSLVIHGIEAWTPPRNRSARWSVRRASRVISVSQVTLDRFASWSGFPLASAEVIPNTVQRGAFNPGSPRPELVRRLELEGRDVIMSLGRMSSRERTKGFDQVIEAMPRLLERKPALIYLVCGDGDDRPRLEAKAHALKVHHAMRFTGFVPEREKPDYYRLADAFVMPSSGEGFGIVILEALACGIPVVASRIDGTREAVRDGMLGVLVDPEDPDALARGILAALERGKGVPDGLDYFSFPRFAERWEQVMLSASAKHVTRH